MKPWWIRRKVAAAATPYTTELAGPNGVSVHFWTGADENPVPGPIEKALRRMCQHRDVVRATWSVGEPTGFWVNSNID